MRRNSVRFLLIGSFLLSLLLWGVPVRAEATPVRTGHLMQNKCGAQVFAGASIQYSDNYGASYNIAPSFALAYLRTIAACQITSAVTLGVYQRVSLLIDGKAIIVYSSPDGTTYYVHREWRVYAITATQWRSIVALLSVKVGNR